MNFLNLNMIFTIKFINLCKHKSLYLNLLLIKINYTKPILSLCTIKHTFKLFTTFGWKFINRYSSIDYKDFNLKRYKNNQYVNSR